MYACLKYYYFLLLLCLAVFVAPAISNAQAVPDTSLNQIIPEGARAKADSARKYESVAVVTLATDTFAATSDSIRVKFKPYIFEPNPKKAGLYSAILPGLGQVYNRQYWKVPIVAAIVGVTVYFFVDNLNDYQKWREAYVARIDNDPKTPKTYLNYTDDNLRQLQNQSKQFLDMTVLLGALGYTVQVLDAVASAHLRNFDISRDISMRVKPVLMPGGVGMGLVMNFK
ncbi:MAG: hypothetical protein EOP51_12545 [Sphingobacteriales bacterium]|nr:MAG: hypothetical protein EOP51_12545 [Sphingobacteriales bacterium]